MTSNTELKTRASELKLKTGHADVQLESANRADLKDSGYEHTVRRQTYHWRPGDDSVEEGPIADVEARRNPTLETDCTVRTAGLDPDPIGDSRTELMDEDDLTSTSIDPARSSDEGQRYTQTRRHVRADLRPHRPRRYRRPWRCRRSQRHVRSPRRGRPQIYLWRPGDIPDQPETQPNWEIADLRQNRPRKRSRPRQRLYPFYRGDLITCSMNLDVPRSHLFAPKLSRLKRSRLALFEPI